MFSKQITSSDAFTDMPVSSQLLYFHLSMEADDDGFVGNPKRIIRTVNVSDDDFKILLAKRFILAFETGVIVIKHWLLHNAVRKDMYKPTQYLDHKKSLKIKDNGVYTEIRNESVTDPVHRLDQVRLDKKEASISFLKRIPKEIVDEFVLKFKCDEAQIQTKANALHDYCESKGRKYKNYKSLLSNALRSDFGERPEKGKKPVFKVVDGVAKMVGYE